ncbi:hypothetical protein BDB00DRAFT_848887, partial [Zychaea mexicana]|uniref:uncharacterized protein n=1 Tax=Zychaea mexicana TaxID=64656 RepID=UPI0022FE5DB8
MPDGNCGFRALAVELYNTEERYVDGRLLKVLDPYSSEWFVSPECSQVAADTFETPIVIDGAQSHIFFPLTNNP